MWLNNFEEAIIGPFKTAIEEFKNDKWIFKIDDGVTLEVRLDGEYESDNGLDYEEDGYEEFFAMSFVVTKIIEDNANLYNEGDLIEINYHNIPISYKKVQ